MATAYSDLTRFLVSHAARLQAQRSLRPIEVNLAIREAESRRRFVMQRGPGADAEAMTVRDEGMANNVDFLLDTLYPGRKVVLWAHNVHVMKEAGAGEPKHMGEWLAKRRGSEIYVIGLFMGHGSAAWNDRRHYQIKPPAPGSLEARLAGIGSPITFVDFSRAPSASSWMSRPIAAREWGTREITVVPNRSLDAAIYVDSITPPEYK